MKIALKESKLKPDLKIAEDIVDLRFMKTNVLLEQLEENIKLREMPIEMQVKRKLLK